MPKAAQFLPDAAAVESDEGIDLEVCQCSGCGLVQLSNDPVHYYRDVIRAAAFSDAMKEFRAEQFSRFIQCYSLAGKKVVEIGCGRGEYLTLMQQTGADTYGLEHAADAVAQCIKNGLRTSQGYIESAAETLDNAPFDAFYMLNFLEHLPDPNAVLRGIFNNLTEGAVGLVEVPNFDMILRNRLFSEFIGDHLLYFTRETLTETLWLNGFELISCEEIWYSYILSAVVKKRQKTLCSHFELHQDRLMNDVHQYLSRFSANKVAIWGAGHQALAVIAMMNLRGRIRYVVDSAPFKQGKYTPATHIPIVAPEMLDTDPVEAVIVMAASYSDEVAKTIQQRFAVSIAVLRDFGLEVFPDRCRTGAGNA